MTVVALVVRWWWVAVVALVLSSPTQADTYLSVGVCHFPDVLVADVVVLVVVPSPLFFIPFGRRRCCRGGGPGRQ